MEEAKGSGGRKVPAPGEAVAWAYGVESVKGTAKFTLVTLALYASLDEDDRWTCWPNRRTLAANVGVSVDRVRDVLRELEAAGLIEREQRRRPNGSLTSSRHVLAVPSPLGEPGPLGRGAEPPTPGGPGTPPPEPPVGTSRGTSPTERPPRVPAEVSRRKVTPRERELAHRILDYWQARTGVEETGTDVGRSIVGRLRQDEELSPEEHKAVIDANLRDPWWDGKAPASVLYGSGKAWAAAKARRLGGAHVTGPKARHPDQAPSDGRVLERSRRRAAAAIEEAARLEQEDAT